jgi:L-ascorbate metabolism protein UlaG (beta-lactamase superfamily)
MTMNDSMTWWGTATCSYEIDGVRVVTDPVLDPSGTRFSLRAPISGRALHYRNLAGTAADEDTLSNADLVLLSHDQHGDNLDAGGRRVTRTAKRTITTRAGAERLSREGFQNVVGLEPWQQVEIPDARGGALRITATPARHGPFGANWIAGPVIGFVIERQRKADEPNRGPIYVSGDTRYFSGLAAISKRIGAIETAVLHMGAARFGPRALRSWLRFSMNADDAAQLIHVIQPKRVVPIHFEGWSHFTENASVVNAHFESERIADRLRWLKRGDRIALQDL